MNQPSESTLLAQLAGKGPAGAKVWADVAASVPKHEAAPLPKQDAVEDKLSDLVRKIQRLTSHEPGTLPAEAAAPPQVAAPAPASGSPAADQVLADDFLPFEPRSLESAGLRETEVQALAMKFLLARGDAAGRDVADQMKLPFVLVDDLLRRLKNEQLVVYRGSAQLNDYIYQLTDIGRERARRMAAQCTYFGAAPVSLQEYIQSVKAQGLERKPPTRVDLEKAFHDLLVSPKMLERLGPAINSGKGMFLYGSAGNGKTSIAERVTRAFGSFIWVPRAISVDGEIIRIYDPVNHVEAPMPRSSGLLDASKIDKRWVRIQRPTIIVGGELTMENLEIYYNAGTGISEAPVQLKSNCGVLVIDDFGRQKMSTAQLLNRWIIPLEKRYDFLNLASGKKVQVPFEQLIIFSTNLEPRDLCDDAFLRRIPYKIEAMDPTEEEFRKLLKIMGDKLGFVYNQTAVEHLIQKHYLAVKRPFRCCQPRDLLLQVRNYCAYQGVPLELKPEYFDMAVENYFAVV